MPLSTTELNRLADSIVASTLTIFLATGAPGSLGTANRVTTGGGTYGSGAAVAAGDWTDAASGDVENENAIPFGDATADVGTVTFWVAFRGSAYVGSGALESATIADGDSYEINAGEVQFLGSST